jgi:hypothetical protein
MADLISFDARRVRPLAVKLTIQAVFSFERLFHLHGQYGKKIVPQSRYNKRVPTSPALNVAAAGRIC